MKAQRLKGMGGYHQAVELIHAKPNRSIKIDCRSGSPEKIGPPARTEYSQFFLTQLGNLIGLFRGLKRGISYDLSLVAA